MTKRFEHFSADEQMELRALRETVGTHEAIRLVTKKHFLRRAQEMRLEDVRGLLHDLIEQVLP